MAYSAKKEQVAQREVTPARESRDHEQHAQHPEHPAARMIELQQTLGNQAVQRMVQPKLAISQPGDAYEREADRVAEAVTLSPETPIPRTQPIVRPSSGSMVQRKCAECEIEEKEEQMLQREAVDQAEPTTVPPIVHKVLHSPGQPLDPETRSFMESRFGDGFSQVPQQIAPQSAAPSALRVAPANDHFEQDADRAAEQVSHVPAHRAASEKVHSASHDFSHVRVHTDPAADASAQAVGALAYTVGHNIVFRAGQFAPGTSAGRQLLAHELTHVMQQTQATPVLRRALEDPIAWSGHYHRKPEADARLLVLEAKRLLNQWHRQELAANPRAKGCGPSCPLEEDDSPGDPRGLNPLAHALAWFQGQKHLSHRDGALWQETLDALRAATAPPKTAETKPATSQPAPPTTEMSPPTDIRSETYKAFEPGQPPPSGGQPGTGMPYRDSCKLRSGTMQWSLVPMVGYVNARIEFTPNPTVAAASKTISFIQTVSDTVTSGGVLGLGSTTSVGITEADVLPKDIDPFYGAKWNPATEKWGDEPTATQVRPGDFRGQGEPREGSRPFTASTGSAVLNDSPMLQINQTKQFETVAVVVETGQVLGSLRWNIQRWRAGILGNDSSTIVRRADCTESASTDFPSVVEKFYSEARRSVVLDGFAAGSADLPATHQQQLAPIVDRLRKEPALRVVVGGAATQDEPNPAALSRSRAEKVRAYLAGGGVAESRIDVEAYGSAWARSPVTPGTLQLNRRVQIRIY